MRIRGIFGILYIASEWLVRLASVNLMWIIFNIPLIFISLGFYTAETFDEIIQIAVLAIIILPFTFFPATSAMTDIVKQWVIDQNDTKLIKPYWTAYKKYYWKSFLGGIIITIIWLIFILDYALLAEKLIVLQYILYFIFVMLLVFTIYFFSTINYIHDKKLRAILKTTLIQTIRKPFLSFAIAVLSLLIIFISFQLLTFLIPLLVGSFIALISCLSYSYTRNEDG